MRGQKTYTGYRDDTGVHVTVNGRPLRHIDYHSPDGFEWGYGGSGPADLALSILANHFNERHVTGAYLRRLKLTGGAPRCWRYHQDFKRDAIAELGRGQADTWTLTSDDINAWLARQAETEG